MDIIWKEIDEAAARIGASAANRAQWRSRRAIPPKWVLLLMKEMPGTTAADFEDVFLPRVQAPALVPGAEAESEAVR